MIAVNTKYQCRNIHSTSTEDGEELRSIIREVNQSHVAPEEILSDSLYFYDYKEKRLKILAEA